MYMKLLQTCLCIRKLVTVLIVLMKCFISMYVVNMMSDQGIMPFEQNLYIHTNITI